MGMKKESLREKLKRVAKKLCRHHDQRRRQLVPRGCFPVHVVGGGEEAEVVRYAVSVAFLKSGCFKRLLDEYEEEIQMHTAGGPITLPCSLHQFEVALYQDRINSRMFTH